MRSKDADETIVVIKCTDEGNENCGYRDDEVCCYNGCDNASCGAKCIANCVHNPGDIG